jgi:membrane protein DedA with SNARE-associated domain
MRKTVIVITAFLLWAECLFFLVYTFITPEANPTSLALLRLVASAGFLALVTGSVAHWFDAREAKAVRSEQMRY